MFRHSRYFSKKDGKHNFYGEWDDSVEEQLPDDDRSVQVHSEILDCDYEDDQDKS